MTSEQRSCHVKIRYRTVGAACHAVTVTLANNHEERGRLQPYLCRFCNGWHIGHCRDYPQPIRRLPRSK